MTAADTLSAAGLRSVVLTLPAHLPITDEFEGGERAERARKRVRYDTQRTHIEKWLGEYDGPGFYNRQKPGGGAKNFYNRFKCAGGLLWLAEALGVPEAVLRDGVAAIHAVPRNPASECGAFRRVVPWSMIAPLLQAQLDGQGRSLKKRMAERTAALRMKAATWLDSATRAAPVTSLEEDDHAPNGM